MDQDTWVAYYEKSPPPVKLYLMSPQSKYNEDMAQGELTYDNDAWDRIMDIVWDAVFAGISKADFQTRIKQVAGDRKPEDVEKAVLFNVVLPLGDLVAWDIDTALKELGVNDSEIQNVPRISLRPVSYGAAVRRIATNAKLSLLSEEMVRRVRDAFVSYSKGVRTIEQFIEILLRSQGEGGLGMSREQADKFVVSMNDFLSTTQVMSEDEYARWMANYENQAEQRRLQPKPTGTPDEIAAAAAAMPRPVPTTALDIAVEAAIAQINHPELDEYLQKRVRNLVSTRLRDVRNEFQVKEVLKRDAKVGGVGFDAVETDRVTGIIEAIYKDSRAKVDAEEKSKIESTLAEQSKKIDERRQRESAERTEWYAQKVQNTKTEQARQVQAFAALQGQSPAALNATVPPIGATVTIERSLASQVLAAQEPPRTMIDAIRAPIKLTGLIEELGGMNLETFRRLAKTPPQAAEKIRQKFETLKQESFERGTEGLQAWRNSPLQQQYLKLVTESFSTGVPVAELVDREHRENPSIPTPEELSAIIALNGQLQF